MPDVLIIGAGVAGMAAAEMLTHAGWQVRLVDKGARAGGRCATRCIGAAADAPWFDYGAQYFTTRDPAFRATVERDLGAGRLTTWSPRVAVAEKIDGNWRLTPSPDERERLIGPRGLNQWVRERLSALPVALECDTRIARVQPDGRAWQAMTDNQRNLHADTILITAPAAQTAQLLDDTTADLGCLARPERVMAACHSLVVRAPAIADVEAIFIKDGALSWAADNSRKARQADPAGHLWTLHAGSDYSDEFVDTPTADLAEDLMAEFARITGQSTTAMTLIRAHRWRYARPGPNAPESDTLSWAEAERGLALAGDWLAGGRVEGAWLSGTAAAQALIDDA